MAQAPLSDHTEELSNLSQALGLQYPVGTKQINKAALVLSYLMSRGIKGTIDLIEDNNNKSLYIDDFSQEIYQIYHSNTVNLYTKSKPIEVSNLSSLEGIENAVSPAFRSNSSRRIANPKLKEENQRIKDELVKSYDLGPNPKKDLIEYKVRKELLTLIKANPGGIDRLEQMYDAQNKTTPFRWVYNIKEGYFNVLLGGKNRSATDANKLTINRLNKATNRVNNLPAETGKDSIRRG